MRLLVGGGIAEPFHLARGPTDDAEQSRSDVVLPGQWGVAEGALRLEDLRAFGRILGVGRCGGKRGCGSNEGRDNLQLRHAALLGSVETVQRTERIEQA